MVHEAMAQKKPRIAVIGAGPAGLMAAETAARADCAVTIYEAMPTPGRKFLMAGRSGLNITHAEDFERFVSRYGGAAAWMAPMLREFSPTDMRAFCADLGVETFVGSSGRVFPRAMKASPLLRAWLARLSGLEVELRTRAKLVDLEAMAGRSSRRMAFAARSTLKRPFSRSAARAGRGSARTAAGPACSRGAA